MSKLILLSADGIGAGKSSLAAKLGNPVSLARAMRNDLTSKYPTVNWNNLTQEFKSTPLAILGGKTPRDILIEYGQECKRLYGQLYWCRRIEEQIISYNTDTIYVIDDVRMVFERDFFKNSVKCCTHIHLVNKNAVKEPQFENGELSKLADYHITWDGL